MTGQVRHAGITAFRYTVGLAVGYVGLCSIRSALSGYWGDCGYHEIYIPANSVLGVLLGLPSLLVAIGLSFGKVWAAKTAVIHDAAVVPLLVGYAVSATAEPARSEIGVYLWFIGMLLLPFLLEAVWLGRIVYRRPAVRYALVGIAACSFLAGVTVSLAIREWVSNWLG